MGLATIHDVLLGLRLDNASPPNTAGSNTAGYRYQACCVLAVLSCRSQAGTASAWSKALMWQIYLVAQRPKSLSTTDIQIRLQVPLSGNALPEV